MKFPLYCVASLINILRENDYFSILQDNPEFWSPLMSGLVVSMFSKCLWLLITICPTIVSCTSTELVVLAVSDAKVLPLISWKTTTLEFWEILNSTTRRKLMKCLWTVRKYLKFVILVFLKNLFFRLFQWLIWSNYGKQLDFGYEPTSVLLIWGNSLLFLNVWKHCIVFVQMNKKILFFVNIL